MLPDEFHKNIRNQEKEEFCIFERTGKKRANIMKEKKDQTGKDFFGRASEKQNRGRKESAGSPSEKKASGKAKELMVEGRNAVLEAIRTNENTDKLYVQEGLGEGPVSQIVAEARKRNLLIVYVPKDKLDQMSETGRHQIGRAHV